jgi:hypothetical protein
MSLVVEAMRAKGYRMNLALGRPVEGRADCLFSRPFEASSQGLADDAPLAVARAALKVRGGATP